jgi:hypothetical protein
MLLLLNESSDTYKDVLYRLMPPLQIRQSFPQSRRLLTELPYTLLMFLLKEKLLIR